ncbi:MAG: methionyl-tRNA formyltransferase, partial [bacterium]
GTGSILEGGLCSRFEQRRCLEINEMDKFENVSIQSFEDVGGEKFQEWFKEFDCDLLLSVFFNQIIPGDILEIPEKGCFNVHPGKLPEFRGFSPVFWQLKQGGGEAACTVHELTEQLDKGPIYRQQTTDVREQDTFFSLYSRLAIHGGDILESLINQVTNDNKIELREQSGSENEYEGFTRDDVIDFYRQGHWFWKPGDLFGTPTLE